MSIVENIKRYVKGKGEVTTGDILQEFASGWREGRRGLTIVFALYNLQLSGDLNGEVRNGVAYFRSCE